ncbi:unnamed protein product [Schistocephalus solidus]|uniref:Uncharacterized protein n=1 Tax=Schistocephalus solidus TaxID=70667 RepID=A0A3P7C0B4_SCHSO|nr:unnamed protein product [Schistocephalus solidus]
MLITVGVQQHSREHETEDGGGQYEALLHFVGHCECFGYRPVVNDMCHWPIVKLKHHVREPLRTAEFLHHIPQSVVIHHIKGFRLIHEGSVEVTVQMIKKDTGEDLSSNVEQRDASVVITELSGSLPLVEISNGYVFESLKNLSLAPPLLEECCEFRHQPKPD